MDISLGQKLKKLRKDADLTQEDVAKHLSVLAKTVSRYELGKTNPSYTMLHELAIYFSVPLSYLMDDNLKYKKTKAQQLIDELIKDGIITSANIDKGIQEMILNAVKIDLAFQLNKKKEDKA